MTYRATVKIEGREYVINVDNAGKLQSIETQEGQKNRITVDEQGKLLRKERLEE